MSEEPTNTIDLSSYRSLADGRVEIYADEPGSIGRLLGSTESINKFELYAERKDTDFSEERHHTIEGSDGNVREQLIVERQTPDTETYPLVFEDMHPSVLVGGPHREDMIVLECRDPKASLMNREDRIESGRDIYLRTYDGASQRRNTVTAARGDNPIPDVEATISEMPDSTEYVLETGPSNHNEARIKGANREEHLNDILETIEVPELDTLLEQANRSTM